MIENNSLKLIDHIENDARMINDPKVKDLRGLVCIGRKETNLHFRRKVFIRSFSSFFKKFSHSLAINILNL